MIIIIDDLLTVKECNSLIKLYKNNIHLAYVWPTECEENIDIKGCSYPINAIKLVDSLFSNVLQRIEEKSKQYFGDDIIIEWGELKRGDKGNYHPPHYDEASLLTVLASITYLNDNFHGGHTIFEDGTTIAPIPGRTVIFDGMKYKHGASENIDNFRYTIPIWYKNK